MQLILNCRSDLVGIGLQQKGPIKVNVPNNLDFITIYSVRMLVQRAKQVPGAKTNTYLKR